MVRIFNTIVLQYKFMKILKQYKEIKMQRQLCLYSNYSSISIGLRIPQKMYYKKKYKICKSQLQEINLKLGWTVGRFLWM